MPVSINLDSVTKLPENAFSLSEISEDNVEPVLFQVTKGKHRTLHWIVSHKRTPVVRVYQLTRSPQKAVDDIKAIAAAGTLTIRAGEKKLLSYRFGMRYPPGGY
ncbi:MAG: hypothetical protein WKI04_06430 [Ferruginibacter sp.]